MKNLKRIATFVTLWFLAGACFPLAAQETSASEIPAQKAPTQADILRIDMRYEEALNENYRPQGFDLMKEVLKESETCLAANPSSYELLWRCARAAIELVETARLLQMPDWKSLSVPLNKKAIEWTEQSKRLEPARVESYFWQMKAMGLVYDAEGLGPFLTRGYVSRSRQNLDKCYALDPSYLDYSPLLAKALYFFNAPPLFGKDIPKALVFFEEFEAQTTWSFEPYQQYTSAAELLMAGKTKPYLERAKALLLTVLGDPTPRPLYRDRARSLLQKIENMMR